MRSGQSAATGRHRHDRVEDELFRAVRSGVVTATSEPLHVGRTTIVVQTNLTDDRGKLVAQVTQTQAVLAE